ncbi:hypothetical protein [Hymenobacter terricola]|uniref:hypothetical protein n=1 Tax=Hymenobacter terricola TaxID=2819236 RepID=UPI001B3065CB|nr:hypothetical protein [Hymenobacter terricola]
MSKLSHLRAPRPGPTALGGPTGCRQHVSVNNDNRSDCLGRSDRGRWRSLLRGLVLLALWVPAPAAHAQQLLNFTYADSLTQALAARYRWAELDSVGRAALLLGTDYPGLRRRLGQAALALNHPALALRHYGRALRENPLDATARYGLALAYLEMNQAGPAALAARGLPDSLRRPLHLAGFQLLTRAELEASGQHSNTMHRDAAGFLRLGLSTRLSPRLSLTQNFSYFGQSIELPDGNHRGGERYPIRQHQYHALLGVQLSPRWRALAGYHVLDSDLGRHETTPGQLGYAALAYARPYWTAKVGFFAGTLTDTTRYQADLHLTVYPLGSLRLYGFGRASVVRSGGRSFPNGVLGAGGRLHRTLWVEAFGGVGQVPVLAELDGTYVYNLVDGLRQRAGANLLILLSRSLSLRLSYGAEQRRDAIDGTAYTLSSLSTALAWTW